MKYFVILLGVMAMMAIPSMVLAQDAEAEQTHEAGTGLPHEDRATVAAFLSCSIAFIMAISILGAAYAVAHIGSAAIGAASEKPEMMGRSLVFVALGEGLAIIGIVVAIMLYVILKAMI